MSIKILLADDSITIQKVIGIIFGGEEYSLTVVDNGKAAIDKALEITPDILLIDALMPGISGYEVCERVRSIPALAAKPILLLTGSFEPFDESKARSCGADDFIAKPFESQQIIAKVTELCERAAAARSIEAAQAEPAISAEPATPFVEQEPPPLPLQEPARPNDIWAAFTTEEPAAAPFFQPANATGEPDSPPQTPEPPSYPWVAVDEQAFSFEETSAAAEPPSPFGVPAAEESPSFGEISFASAIEPAPAQPEAESIAPAADSSNFHFASDEPSVSFAAPAPPVSHEPAASFDLPTPALTEELIPEIVVSPPEEAAPAATEPVSAPAALSLSEDQLRAAIQGVSKDVIERIVWEVVPDLAETLIKEAIRRIREGR